MALQFAHGVIQWLSTDALNATYTVSGLPFQPKAFRFIATRHQSASDANTQTVSKHLSVGLAFGTGSRRCVSASSLDGSSAADCGCSVHNNCIAAQQDSGGFVTGRLDLNAINSDGFQLIVDDVPTVSFTVEWQAWGGSDITTLDVQDFAEPAATGVVDYPADGFVSGADDQVVLFATVQSTAAVNSAQANDSGLSLGFASGGNDADNVVVCGNSDDGSATMDTDGYCKTGECVAMIAVAGGDPDARAKLTQYGTNTFRLDWLARAVTGRRGIYLTIKGGRWKAGAYTIDGSSASATATVSGLPFAPIGLLSIGRMTAEQTAGVSSAHDRIGLGCGVSPTDRFSIGVLDEDGTANAEIDQTMQYDQLLSFPSVSGTLQAAYNLNAMNSDGVEVIVDVAGGVASEWQGYLLFGSAALQIAPGGISTAEAFGAAAIAQQVRAAGLTSDEAVGAPTVSTGAQLVGPGAIGSGESFGSPALQLQIRPSSLSSAELFGDHIVSAGNLIIVPTAMAGSEAFGTGKITRQIRAQAIAASEAFGSARLVLFVRPSSVGSGEDVGTPSLARQIRPSGLATEELFGAPILVPGPVTIVVTGIAGAEAFGSLLLSVVAPAEPHEVFSATGRTFLIDAAGRVYELTATARQFTFHA